ncbi:MAG TPA: glycosyltransferase [Caulobacteraceae bacterium]|nr:glycosyltransferase [Caulobacteraceae bacterium]
MKVLITATSLRAAYGGPAFSVSALADALGARDVEIGLWAADGSAAGAELLPSEARVRRMPGPLKDAVAGFAPDLIHDNGLWLAHNHRVAEMAAASGTPRIVSTRGMLEPWAIRHKGLKKQVAWRLYQRRDLQRAAVLHATAQPEAENLRAFGLGSRIVTIANGIDLPAIAARAAPSDRAARTALFLGRIYPVKGLPMLIEAWARVRPASWRLVIAGPDEAGHQRLVEDAVAVSGLGDVVSFVGPVSGEAKAAWLRDADLLVLPSHSESFGMAVAEALAHGTPVLTTTAAPWPALEDRRCGWRAAPNAEALAAALRHAFDCDAPTLAGMGAAGRAYVAETLGWDRIAAQFAALYAQLIRTRGAAVRAGEAAA